MSAIISCPRCGGAAMSESPEPASSERYRCSQCGHVFDVRIHYKEEPRALGIIVYKAFVHAGAPDAALKNRIKAAKVFRGRSNFYVEDLDRQVALKLPTWDLGYYSADEVVALRDAAEKIGLPVEFVLSE